MAWYLQKLNGSTLWGVRLGTPSVSATPGCDRKRVESSWSSRVRIWWTLNTMLHKFERIRDETPAMAVKIKLRKMSWPRLIFTAIAGVSDPYSSLLHLLFCFTTWGVFLCVKLHFYGVLHWVNHEGLIEIQYSWTSSILWWPIARNLITRWLCLPFCCWRHCLLRLIKTPPSVPDFDNLGREARHVRLTGFGLGSDVQTLSLQLLREGLTQRRSSSTTDQTDGRTSRARTESVADQMTFDVSSVAVKVSASTYAPLCLSDCAGSDDCPVLQSQLINEADVAMFCLRVSPSGDDDFEHLRRWLRLRNHFEAVIVIGWTELPVTDHPHKQSRTKLLQGLGISSPVLRYEECCAEDLQEAQMRISSLVQSVVTDVVYPKMSRRDTFFRRTLGRRSIRRARLRWVSVMLPSWSNSVISPSRLLLPPMPPVHTHALAQ